MSAPKSSDFKFSLDFLLWQEIGCTFMNKSVRIDDEKELCTEVASLMMMMMRTRMMMMLMMMIMVRRRILHRSR